MSPNKPEGIETELLKTQYDNLGGLLQMVYKPIEKISFTVGSRIDKDKRFGTTVNPRLGVVYRPNLKLNFKILYGRAFLAPSPQYMFDTYGTFQTTDQGNTYSAFFFQLPNPDLKPQTIQTYELGTNTVPFENFHFSASIYYSELKDLISPTTKSDKINELYPNYTFLSYPVTNIQINDNLGSAIIYGGSLRANFLFSNDIAGYKFFTSYSYVDGIFNVDSKETYPERNLPGIAPHTFRFGSTFSLKNKLIFSARFILIGKQRAFAHSSYKLDDNTEYQEIPGYHVLNVNVRYNFKKLSLFVAGKNITNQRYRNVNIGCQPDGTPEGEDPGSAAAEFSNGAPQNPIRISGGLSFNFN